MPHSINADQLIAQQLATLAEYAEAVRGARWIIAAVAEVFDVDGSPVSYTSQSIDGSVNVLAYVSTAAAIVETRRQLAARGIRLREGDKVAEHPEHSQQHHPLKAEGGTRVSVTYFLTVGAAGEKRCEYVKVGEKTITQPVYELRCTEATPELATVGAPDLRADPAF